MLLDSLSIDAMAGANNADSGSTSDELQQLIEGCLRNDRAMQSRLYKRYYGKMMAMCMRYMGNKDEAMEALNAGFLKVFEKLGTYSHGGSFEGWIRRIIYNTTIDLLRQRIRYREMHLDKVADEPVSTEIIDSLYTEDLMKLIEALPGNTRVVFNMFAIEGYGHKEIGKTLGISEGTSKWQLNEARKLLKAGINKLTNK